jgi:two-component system cell cycle sensor histidine kinase/response regulator CckA
MKRLKALIIEDSENDAMLLLRHLTVAYDLEYKRVDTAAATRAALTDESWDIVLSDYSMPEFSALTALEIVKELELELPFIVISGTIGEETAVEAMLAGADDYFIKGSLGRLIPAIERELRESEMRNAKRAAEARVKQSEENFRALVEASTLYTWQVGREGVSRELMDWFVELSGRRVDSVQDILDLIHPDDVAGARSAWDEAVAGRSVFTTVCRFRSRDNTFRYLAVRGVQVFNDDGTFRQWIGTFNDITERKTAEEELRKSEALNRAVLNSTSSAIAVLDQNGRVKTVNRAWDELATDLGVEEHWQAAVGSDYPLLCEQSNAALGSRSAAIANGIRDILRGTRQVFATEYQVQSGPQPRWVYFNVNELKTREGGAVVVHTDITERKLIEEALRKNEAQLQLVADTVPTVVAYLDTNCRFVFANKACRKWFGTTDEEIVGQTLKDVVGDEKLASLGDEIQSVLRGEEVKLERNAVLHPGRYIFVNYHPDRDSNGNVIGFFLFMVDLTESRQAEEALRKSEEQLRQSQKLESIGRLAGGIAHDFNNMLTAINGYSELALLKLGPDDPLRRNIEEIKKAGERSASLTQQLLTFSRRQILEVKVLDVNQVVEDSMVLLQRVIGEDVRIVTHLEPELWQICGDKGQLTQVLLNLAVNSRDAMPRGGTITISTSNTRIGHDFVIRRPGSREGLFAKISVTDTGIGMDTETQKHIFEPFFTTKEIGKGTGLGLSMVYGIVKQLNGYVWVTSQPDGGTVFDVYFPRAKSVADVGEDESADAGEYVGSETVLLVEDEDIVRELSRQVLESCGYDVIEASSGGEALEIYKGAGRKIDLLMTDMVMPEIDGTELARRLDGLQPGLKVLFTSGYLEHSVQMNDLENGTNFIQKPFTYEQLARTIRTILDRDK